tara:strand:- start:652 stop:975 length:324 start_codon:yes stop_codon:yes gene_type:complete
MAFIDGIVETEKKIACHKDYNNLKKNIADQSYKYTDVSINSEMLTITSLTLIESSSDLLENKIEVLEEEIECVDLFLDDKGIPRRDPHSHFEYSLVGRIKLYKGIEK